jgi:hypothetical protein
VDDNSEQPEVVATALQAGMQCHEQEHRAAEQNRLHQCRYQQKGTRVHAVSGRPCQKHKKGKGKSQRQQDTAKWRDSVHGDTILLRKQQ